MIRYECPACGSQSAVPDSYAGRQEDCSRCGATIEVPHPEATPEPAPEPPPARGRGEGEDWQNQNIGSGRHRRPGTGGHGGGQPRGRRGSGRHGGQGSGGYARGAAAGGHGGHGGGDAERRCPYCGETIKAVARKCRHCGEFLDTRLRQSVRDRDYGQQLPVSGKAIAGVIFAFCCPIVGLICALMAHNEIQEGRARGNTLVVVGIVLSILNMVANVMIRTNM